MAGDKFNRPPPGLIRGSRDGHWFTDLWQYLQDLGDAAGYSDLTEFVDQTAGSVFYSDDDGDVQEVALGDAGTFLRSGAAGGATAPAFAAPDITENVGSLYRVFYTLSTTDVKELYFGGDSGKYLRSNGFSAPSFETPPGTGYTDLTEFVDQTNWRVFYSNGSGDVTELALGSSGTYLKSNGASAAPTWESPALAGDYTTMAEFVDEAANQIFYSDASGDMKDIILGSDGDLLKSQGLGSAPDFVTPTLSLFKTESATSIVWVDAAGDVKTLALGSAGQVFRCPTAPAEPTFADVNTMEIVGEHSWSMFFSENPVGAGLNYCAVGASGTYLQGNGTAAAPSFQFPKMEDFVSENNWKLFYTNGSGNMTELSPGSEGQVLTAHGNAAPTWETP